MVRSKKPHTTGDTSPNPAIEKRRLSPTLFFLAVILIPTGMLVTIALIGTDSSGPDLQPLVGLWSRTDDGGYRLEVRKVHADSNVEVSYSNPQRAIHVEKSNAKLEGDSIKLYVEMRDQGYAGSNYKLVYDPEQDALHGKYYQKSQEDAEEVVIDVSFRRIPKEPE